jgi:TAG lipase / steryl ester hydrolase / phospholipase A2 / LPA acyltransferase
MQQARSYGTWLEAAEELDRVEHNDRWRGDDASPLYDHELLARQLAQLRRLREERQAGQLTRTLQESLHRHLGEISNPALYGYAHAGTKHLISAYLEEAEAAMRFLCEYDTPELSLRDKLQIFAQASHNFGRSALILSGGLSFGIYHLGVIKALLEQRLLPTVISGSSMGAIVAAAACTRDDDELDDFLRCPEQIHLDALRLANPLEVFKRGKLMDSKQLLVHIEANVRGMTFKEAYEHSGRVLNVTVSPTRSRQKPRVLNHLTAPDVMVTHSAHASCAMPPGYPPVMLHERDRRGSVVPYLPTERWIDGSLHGDVPMLRLSRLHNVNHSIVSQANPHVVPFIAQGRSTGPVALTWHLVSSMARAQANEILGTSRDLWGSAPARPLIDRAHAVTDQSYLGDINIHFPFQPTLYRKMLSNPDLKALRLYIRLGEQATWPQIAIVRDQTRLSRTFEEVLARLTRRVAEAC